MAPFETNLHARDQEVLLHPVTSLVELRRSGPFMIERGKGVHVWDSDGRRYIEGLAGLWCTALGHGVEELADAAREQMKKLAYSHLYVGRSHEAAVLLADRLVDMAPFPVSRVFFGTSGSDANDTQIKLIWYYNNVLGRPRKKKIISRLKAYHGSTIASGSLSGLPVFHKLFDLPIANVLHTACPHFYWGAEPGETEEEFATRLAAGLEQLIVDEGPDTVAAFIAEPVMGAGGVIVPPRTYFEKVQAVLKKYDVLLIDDEVICGFGRTGNVFGAETVAMQPDTITLAKALSSAYLPISAVLIPEPMYEVLEQGSDSIGVFGHGYTHRASRGRRGGTQGAGVIRAAGHFPPRPEGGPGIPVEIEPTCGVSACRGSARCRSDRGHRVRQRQGGQKGVFAPGRSRALLRGALPGARADRSPDQRHDRIVPAPGCEQRRCQRDLRYPGAVREGDP